MKILFILLLFLLSGKFLFAQKGCDISGIVADSSKKTLHNVTVKLYSAADSLRTTTDEKGHFIFSKINAKQITIQVTAVGFNTYMTKYTIKPDMKEIDLGTIILKSGEINLPDVVIKAKPVAIKYMQDTVEYDARAFDVQDDDRVSDLLRQLPGVELDDDNNVTAMGKTMTKLRVNGEDFFTNNVKEFINKLPAGIVSKIQVIDDFGDKANFTGIKAGEPQKMLNIVTKPGMNNGQFGEVATTAGTNRQIGANGNVNLWKGSKQINGGIGYNIADNGAGLSQNKVASLNVGNKIGKTSRYSANYNFLGNNNNSNSTQTVETVNSLGKLNSQLENSNYNENKRHSLGLTLNQTTKNIYLSSTAFINYNQTRSIANSLNYQTGFIKQDFKNNSINSNNSPAVNASIDFSKKLKKNTVSGNFSFSNLSNKSNQDLITNTLYYDTIGVLEKDSLLHRRVYNMGNNKQITFGLNYSLFLKRDTVSSKSISANYRGQANITESDLQTFVYNPTTLAFEKSDTLSLFSKNVAFNQSLDLLYHQMNKKSRMTAGLNISPNLIKNNYPELNSTFTNNYINISPSLNYNKTITPSKSISMSYYGRNTNPSILQMQPVKNTQNLQNIIIGNPNLKSAFSHSLSSTFNYFGKKSQISFMSGFSVGTIINEIVNNIILIPDTLGAYKQETRFENANGNYNFSGNYSLSIPFKLRKYAISLVGNFSKSRKVAIVNNEETFNKGLNFSQRITGTFNVKKFTTNIGLNYSSSTNNDTNYGFQQGADQIPYNLLLDNGQSFFKTKSISTNFSASLRLKNFRFSLNGNYIDNKNENNTSQNVNTNTQSLNFGARGDGTVFKSWNFNFMANKIINKGYTLTNTNPFIINLTFGKSFLKNRALNFTMSVNDLLNEGNNVSQRVQGNSIIENRSNQVMRVFLLGLSYNISTFGGKNYKLRTN